MKKNVVVAVEDWVADTTYTDYDYKAVLTLTGMLSTYEPSVVFGLAWSWNWKLCSVCLAGNWYNYNLCKGNPECKHNITFN